MERKDKLMLIGIIALAVIITISLSISLGKRVTNCEENGGVLVKATSGYVCVDKKAIL